MIRRTDGEQRNHTEDHARGAVAALKSALVEEGLLDWMQRIAFGEAFDGQNCFFIGITYRGEAGGHAFAVQQDGAGAALTLTATVFGASELQIFAQDIEQGAVGIGGDSSGPPVDGKCNFLFHMFSSAKKIWWSRGGSNP